VQAGLYLGDYGSYPDNTGEISTVQFVPDFCHTSLQQIQYNNRGKLLYKI
jgi:hypothetical protein